MNTILEQVEKEVEQILGGDMSGHGMGHVRNVLKLSRKFAEREEADLAEVSLTALLHDVDDYKIFGDENAKMMANAKRTMENVGIDAELTEKVLCNISEIGYGKRLKGTVPTSIEARIVSDADMCDALGANSILRTHEYGRAHGRTFFDEEILPVDDISSEEYLNDERRTTDVCHLFEKVLRLKDLMLTEAGKIEAEKRHKIVVEFLYNFFEENDVKEEWFRLLEKFEV